MGLRTEESVLGKPGGLRHALRLQYPGVTLQPVPSMTGLAPVGGMSRETPIRLGVSSCLLGERVRYDGGHKRDAYLVEQLGEFVEWVLVCPEVEIGLDVPRETIQIEQAGGGTMRLLGTASGTDHTDEMRSWARRQLTALAEQSIAGYVLKSQSPSCGVERVPVIAEDGVSKPVGRGIFAAELIERFPHLPVEEESGLEDPDRRDSFLERVFAYGRLRSLFAGRWRRRDAVAFHTRHKLQLRAHSPKLYTDLGRLVGRIADLEQQEFRTAYEAMFMETLRTQATRGKHADVLRHVMGHLRPHLDAGECRELLARIDEFQIRSSALAVPLGLMQGYVRRFDVPYLREQSYIEPDPRELALRSGMMGA